MNRKVLYILLIMCYGSASFARPVVVRDSARSEEPVIITEPFDAAVSAASYGNITYSGAITWQLKNGKVNDSDHMFGDGNSCAILVDNGQTTVTTAASLTSEHIQGLREVRCKMKRSSSAVSMAIYISADQTKWMDITKTYSILVAWDGGTTTCTKSEMNEYYIPTKDDETYTISIALPRDTDVYVRWIAYSGIGSEDKYAFIDDVELVTHPWVYTQHEEDVPDYIRPTDVDHQIGIVCWPQAVHKADYAGATFYEVAYREGTASLPTDLVVSEVEDLEAGMPYIYIASGSAITADGHGESVTTAQHRNGLYGTLTKIENSEILGNKWVLYKNELWQIAASSTASIKANSGYIDMTEVQEESTFTPVPGRKYRSLSERSIVTDRCEIMMPADWHKVLLNGTFVIIRDGQQYDVLGNQQR